MTVSINGEHATIGRSHPALRNIRRRPEISGRNGRPRCGTRANTITRRCRTPFSSMAAWPCMGRIIWRRLESRVPWLHSSCACECENLLQPRAASRPDNYACQCLWASELAWRGHREPPRHSRRNATSQAQSEGWFWGNSTEAMTIYDAARTKERPKGIRLHHIGGVPNVKVYRRKNGDYAIRRRGQKKYPQYVRLWAN